MTAVNAEILGYGVCRLSVVPVRAQPSDKSEQVTQLLFGDHYTTRGASADRKWLMITTAYDEYTGWIGNRQHHEISYEYFEFINRADFKITTDLFSGILYNKMQVVIPLGSIIPISASELFRLEEQFAFNGEAKSLGQKRDREFLVSMALKYLNAPYQWGGKNPLGIDCSGLTQMAFKLAGYRLPRDTVEQWRHGTPVATVDGAVPGDLAFFKTQGARVSHVGIVLPDENILHASGRVRMDLLHEEGILDPQTKVYTHTLVGIRRILPGNHSA